jgi:hypothetical protein
MRRFAFCLIGLVILMPGRAVAAAPTQGLAANEVLRGQFVQERHLKGFNAPLRTEGRFVLAPGHGLIWQAEKPFAVDTVITPAGLAQQVNGTQTLRLESSKLPFLARLYDMLGGALAGNWGKLESDFTVSRSGDAQNWRVTMLPRKADDIAMPFRSIAVTGSRFVDTVVLAKPDGDSDVLTFLDQSVSSAPLSAAETAALATATQ